MFQLSLTTGLTIGTKISDLTKMIKISTVSGKEEVIKNNIF